MNFKFTEDDNALLEAFQTFSKQVVAPWADRVENGESTREVIAEMANAGLVGMVAPEEYGGSNCSYLQLTLAMEDIGRYSAAIADHLNMSNCNLILPLMQLGTEKQKAKWIPRIASGEAFVAFALTEPGAGSDTMGMTCRAVADGDDYIINGQKCFITDAAEANVYMVFAVTSAPDAPKKEVTAFLLDRAVNGDGVTTGKAEPTMGMHGSPIFDIFFENVRVPKENIIGGLGGGFKAAMVGLNPGRCALSAAALGIAQRVIDDTVTYVKNRKMFRKTLADFQNTQFVLAEAQSYVDAARLLVQKAAVTLDEGGDAAMICAEAKLVACESAKKAVDVCLQLHGGYGYSKEYHVERAYRDVRIFTIFEGASEVQKHVIAKCMGLR